MQRCRLLIGELLIVALVVLSGCGKLNTSANRPEDPPSFDSVLNSHKRIKEAFQLIGEDSVYARLTGLETIAHIIVINEEENPNGTKDVILIPGAPREFAEVPALNKAEITVILQEVVKLLMDTDVAVREAAVLVLEYGKTLSLEPLENSLNSGILGTDLNTEELSQSFFGANGAAYALIKIGMASRETATSLLESINPNAQVAGLLYFGLGPTTKGDLPVEPVLDLLTSEDEFIRNTAVQLVGRKGAMEHSLYLVPLLNHQSENTRRETASALYELCGIDNIVQDIIAVEDAESGEEREKALQVLEERIKEILLAD